MPATRPIRFEFQGPTAGTKEDVWHLLEAAEVHVPGWEPSRLVIPKIYQGFNGTSIPAALWPMFGHPLHKRYVRAALVHDAAYQCEALHPELGVRNRKDADILFRRILRLDGVSHRRALLMYAGVRVGGGSSWLRDQPPTRQEELEIGKRIVAFMKQLVARVGAGTLRLDLLDLLEPGSIDAWIEEAVRKSGRSAYGLFLDGTGESPASGQTPVASPVSEDDLRALKLLSAVGLDSSDAQDLAHEAGTVNWDVLVPMLEASSFLDERPEVAAVGGA